MYTSLSTRRNSIDKWIRADVNFIRFEFETGIIVEMFWPPGTLNLVAPGTNTDRTLCEYLQLFILVKSTSIHPVVNIDAVISRLGKNRNCKRGLI